MFELPADDPTNPLKLADWLELYAILSPDHNASRGDLESALRTAAFAECADDEEIELKVLEVFDELDQRDDATREAYPFNLTNPYIIQLKSEKWEDFPAYVFCLCLSYFGVPETNITPKLFERVSCLAARGYLSGEALGFGAPRIDLPSVFSQAITEMCKHIGEGIGFRDQSTFRRQDDALDLVAWTEFADRHPSKLRMFGQCAAGRNWESKLGDLQPEPFCDQWMLIPPILPPIKSFFMPHRIEQGKWESIARKGGILFDRCRIAFWAHQEAENYASHIGWARDQLVKCAL